MKKFYTFSQSNPGGYFIKNDKISEYVIIQAESAEEANDFAEDVGIYFDGIRKKIDCSCCNDRWYRASEWGGKEKIELDEIMLERGYKIYADEEWII
jgi:hypothetical protein